MKLLADRKVIIISVVFCCTAGFCHPFSVSPYFSVLSCPFECNKATIICQIVQHLNSSSPSCWFTFHSAFSNFMQKSIVSWNIANPSMFPLPNTVQYLPVFVYSPVILVGWQEGHPECKNLAPAITKSFSLENLWQPGIVWNNHWKNRSVKRSRV